MGSFHDLDDALLESILKWLNSTHLRNTACLVCKRWATACNTRTELWRICDIDIPWEIYNPQGPISRSPATHSLAVHCGVGTPDGSSNHRGSGRSRHSYSRTRVNRSAFLSRDVLSRWLEPHAPHIEVLCISHTEVRTSVVGYNPKAPSRHDLQPADLNAMLASLPSLTELHLVCACNLLPEPAVLLLPPQPQPPPLAQLQSNAVQQAAQNFVAGFTSPVSLAPITPARPPREETLISERLRRLSLCRGGYDFQSDDGSAQAAALGGLQALQDLNITLEPASSEGLHRLPEAWSALTNLTALKLGGHMRLRRLPSWFSDRFRQLHNLTLDGCGLHKMPAAALAGLPELRLLSLDYCPLGRSSAAVSLDAWWQPEEEGCGGGAAAAATSRGCTPATAVGSGVGFGVEGLEVLQLRCCDILALPYSVTRLTNLRRLELGSNPLGELAMPPDDGGNGRDRCGTGQMRDVVLRYLRESGDRGFRQLAASPRLGHLGLERCGLSSVPLGVSELTQLTSLDLSDNAELELDLGHVAELPERLPQLACLRLRGTAAEQQLHEGALDVRLHSLVVN